MKKIYSLGGKVEQTPEEYEAGSIAAKIRRERDSSLIKKNDLEKTIDGALAYNKALSEPDPLLKNLILPKGKVLIRLFREPSITKSGLYLPKTVTEISENTGKPKLVTSDTGEHSYCSRAVVVAVGADCEVKVGNIIDLYMNVFKTITQYWSPINRFNIEKSTTIENYFTIPETHINFIWTN